MTFLKGFTLLIFIIWGLFAALMAYAQFVYWASGGDGGPYQDTSWVPSDAGWWQLLIYAPVIALVLAIIYAVCIALGEWWDGQ